MFPYVSFLGLNIGTYTIMAACGAAAMSLYIIVTNHSGVCGKIRFGKLLVLIAGGCIGILAGAGTLGGISTLIDMLQAESYIGLDFAEFIDTVVGASAIYGGIFGWILASILGCGALGVPHRTYMGIYAPSQALLYTFGRLGCMSAGCCYGVPHTFGYTLVHSPEVTRFPTQAIEAIYSAILFVVLAVLSRKWGRRGAYKTLPLYLLLYSLMRFMLEFMRGDAVRDLWVFTLNQWVAIAVILLSIDWWVRMWQRPRQAIGASNSN